MVATIVICFTYILGNLGETIEDYQDFWDLIALIGLGVIYGAPSGIILLLVARILMFHHEIREFIIASAKCATISIFVGCIGGLRGPFVAAIFCCASFLVAVMLRVAFLPQAGKQIGK